MYLFSVLPFLYFMKTRLKGKIQKISWIFVYFIPAFILFYNFISISIDNFVLLILSLTFINYIYENGYLQNDIKTIKRENDPTLRLSLEEIENIDKRWNLILILRSLICLSLLFLFYIFSKNLEFTMILFLIGLLLQILYLIYNSIRNFFNLILILPINYIRFYGFLIPFVDEKSLWLFLLCTFFLYPFLKVLEFTKQSRYKLEQISRFIGIIDIFRIKYYLLIFAYFLILNIFYDGLNIYICLAFYYLIFRILSFYILQKKKNITSELAKNTKKSFRNNQ